MIAGIFGGSGFVAPCTRVLSNSDLSRRFVHRTSDRSRSEVLCTHGGQPSELVQSPSENDRLTHHCHIVETGNESYRLQHSSLAAQAKIKSRERKRKDDQKPVDDEPF